MTGAQKDMRCVLRRSWSRLLQDYRRALRRLYHHPGDQAAQDAKTECERFFRRDIGMYSDLDGESIIRAIRKRVEGEMKHE